MENSSNSTKKPEKWYEKEKWLQIKGITSEEIYTPCGAMQRGEPLGKSKFNSSTPAPAQNKKDGKIMQFGKYKGRLVKDIQEKDPSYIMWCIENVKNFKV